jgi:hypothetical protein
MPILLRALSLPPDHGPAEFRMRVTGRRFKFGTLGGPRASFDS